MYLVLCIKTGWFITNSTANFLGLGTSVRLPLKLPSKDMFWWLTDQNGYYKIDCPAGWYIVIAIKKTYKPAWKIVNVPDSGCVTADFDVVK
jgi:hypothetical protein